MTFVYLLTFDICYLFLWPMIYSLGSVTYELNQLAKPSSAETEYNALPIAYGILSVASGLWHF